MQNYCWDGTHLHWREADNIPPAAQFISSPYDVDAHYARKYTTQWVGYKVHITETCEGDLPHLITHIETTPGPTADGATTPTIHAALQQRDLLPGTRRQRMPFERSMHAAPASKARSRAGRGAHAYDGPATWTSDGSISAIS